MSRQKTYGISALAVSCAIAAFSLSGCVTAKNYWLEYKGSLDKSGRETTGYYEHADMQKSVDKVRIPAGLDDPGINKDLSVPDLPPGAANGPVGEKMDIRPPIAQYRSDAGLHTQWQNNEAIVWFERGGAHDITDEDQAWAMLGKMLERMRIGVDTVSPDDYELMTSPADFNEYGQPYTASAQALGNTRYRQTYRLRIGRNAAGELGIATQLRGSMTMLSNGLPMEDKLDPIEQKRFAMGFSNHILHELELNRAKVEDNPLSLSVALDQDENQHTCYVVNAPFDTTMDLIKRMLPKFNCEITSYDTSKAQIAFSLEEEDPDFYRGKGVDPFGLESGKYRIRVGIEGERSLITFYDDKDNPLPATDVSRMFSGFSKALANEYEEFLNEKGQEKPVDDQQVQASDEILDDRSTLEKVIDWLFH